MMNYDDSVLFAPFRLGGLTLRNRVCMAPLTRDRATPGSDTPHALNAEYYAQRAGAGLIVSEGTQISPSGKGYAWTPGIYSPEQVAGWKLVTEAVHARGGVIFAQLWHVGRMSHPSLQPGGVAPVGPSAIQPVAQRTFIENGTFVEVGEPRALERSEIPKVVDDFRRAAQNALDAGFDGVEIHGANGYLLAQFLSQTANQRTDEYGGSVENRVRFPVEVAKAVVSVAGAERTGIRISPCSPLNGVVDPNNAPEYFAFVPELDALRLAYVHIVEGSTGGDRNNMEFDYRGLRKLFRGAWMVNNGYTRDLAIEAIGSGYADLIAFGRPFLANPDLPVRLQRNAPLNEPDPATFFGGTEKGYTDYPALEAVG